VLPEIVAAVGQRLDVLFDGGVRRGTHIVKAMALGAKGVLLGRAYAYALSAAGEAGVVRMIELLTTEIDVTIAHMGVTRVAELHQRRSELLRGRAPALG
jgi:isopentenyl diphosphate isomerase/L-lactate dehydrogenase-like FMN-dependent dehydrogenase